VKQEKAQVVTIHDLSLLPLGWLLKKVLKIRLVYDAHELETEKNGLHGISQKIARFIERQFVASVDLMTVASDSIADWYEKAYISCRPAIIKNAPRLRTNQKTNLFREKLGISQHQRIFLYQGGLVQGRGIQLILDAFKVRSQKNAVLVFLGYGNLATEIKEASLLYSNIFYVPAVPPDDLLEYTASADFGVALIQDTCLCDYYCMPNKLFEYAMAALPVLISNMKDMAEAVELHQFGTVLSEYSVKSLNIAIDNLCSSDSSELSDNAYNYASANSWEQQEKILIKEYSNLLLR
jgi:glycosyltransferase involved in cell wall biosynthesis